jgi:hypothetical protein
MARGEGYPTPEQNPDSDAQKAREGKFRLYKEPTQDESESEELNSEGLVERPLMPIETVTPLELDKWARQFIAERANLSSRKRVVDARIQNRLLRAALGGEGVEVTSRFQDAVKETPRMSGMNAKERDEIVTALGKVSIGVRNCLDVVPRLQSKFAAETRSAGRDSLRSRVRQEICTNDHMDAGDKIDLVSIQHHETDDGEPKISRIDLIQVKTGKITEAEEQAIYGAHARFYAALVEKGSLEDRMRETDYRKTVEASLDFKESKEAVTAPEKLRAALHRYGDFILGFATAKASEDGSDAAIIESIKESGLDEKHLAIAAQFSNFEALYALFCTQKGLSSEAAVQKVRVLREWANAQDVSPEDFRRLHSDYQPKFPVIGNVEFRSVIMTGGSGRSEKVLMGPERGLTKK